MSKNKAAFDHETFLSPFTWRYGSDEMRGIWSEAYKWRLARRVWVALAAAQHQAELVSAKELADVKAHVDDIDLARAAEIEAEIHHDLMAQLRTYAEQCPVGGGILHLGATSTDIEENVDALRIRDSLDILLGKLRLTLGQLADRIKAHAGQVCMGFTHLQPAEPTTVGYRLATYAQDLLADAQEIKRLRDQIRGKGIKGAVGTAASYSQLLEQHELTPGDLETLVMDAVGLEAYPITSQVYPRRQDYRVLVTLAGMAATIYRLAFDIRLLQSPPFGEWHEPFGSRQVGSSAMPFKRNPINTENMDSLARYVAALPRVAWDNAAHTLLERTLDDSGNRRVMLPNAFLACDELLKRADRVLRGLQINEAALSRNLQTYGMFSATERVLMAAVQSGADRQAMHEVIRQQALAAWEAVSEGRPNPLVDLLAQDEQVQVYLSASRIRELMDPTEHIGDAAERAREAAQTIQAALDDLNAPLTPTDRGQGGTAS